MTLALAWTVAIVLDLGGASGAAILADVGLSVAAFVAAAAALVAGSRGDRSKQWFWRLVGGACGLWGLGTGVWAFLELVLDREPFPSPAEVAYVGFAPFMCAAFLTLSAAPRTAAARARAVLDGVMIGGSLFIISWQYLLHDVFTQSGGTTLAKVFAIYYPASGVVTATIVVYMILGLRHRRRVLSRPMWLVSLGVLGFVAADSGFAYLVLRGTYMSGSLIDIGWMAGLTCITIAALMHRSARPPLNLEDDDRTQLGQLVPYGVITLALLARVIQGTADRVGLYVLASVVAALMIRQVLVLRENVSLTLHLESRVARRTAELEASERRFRGLVQHSSDVVVVLDRRHKITYVSDSMARVFGYTPDDLLGCELTVIASVEEVARVSVQIRSAPQKSATADPIELEVRHASGRVRQAEVTMTNLLDDPSVAGIVLNIADVSEQRALEQKLTHKAFHDALTGLPNRALFMERLTQALKKVRNHHDVAIVMIDLDDFKKINDSLGHACGDAFLMEVARRLPTCVRPEDTVARFGGDEFAVLLQDFGGDVGAGVIAQRICSRLCGTLTVDGHELYMQASAGLALAVGAYDAAQLLRNAGLAMYRAKATGEGGFAFYDPTMHATLVDRIALEADLRRAVKHEQLTLHYQPTRALESGRLVGFEALIRWRHDERGNVPPAVFIPIAEDAGLIREIGRWVLREACRQWRSWIDRYPELDSIYMSVNLSATELSDPDLVDFVAQCLSDHDLEPGRLVIEITESVMMERFENALDMLRRLKQLGVLLAIDDFGTGYSSLSHLHRFPVDVLKIDRSFVQRLSGPSGDGGFVRAIIALSRTLSLTTVAEGIEEEEQLTALQEAGCTIGQGYYFSPPVAPEVIEEHLPAWAAGSAVLV